MEQIIYSETFKNALQFSKTNKLFLGLGNPNAKILFIGKEAAIDKEASTLQYEIEVVNNVTNWEHNCEVNKQFDEVDNWFMDYGIPKYNPLYPYKGQKNTIHRHKNVEDKIISNGGTSKTWYNYQKIIDALFYNAIQSENINFHEHVFISELNQETGKYSHLVPKDKREKSIANRTSLLETSFFRDFPITIVAVGHYVRDFNIDLEVIFGMNYDNEKSKIYSEGLKNEYINIHFDSIEEPTKLLIHTNQLSTVSNELIKKIGVVCSLFLEGKFNNKK